MEVPPVPLILLGFFYHLIVCGNLTRSAMRWSRAHPLGADASKALEGPVLLAVSSGAVILLAGLVTCGLPLYSTLMHGDRDHASIYAMGLVFSLLAALPLSGLYPPHRRKAKLMAILGAIASLTTLPLVAVLTAIVWVNLE